MENIFNQNNKYQSYERVADSSTRFNSHPSKNPYNSIFEPIDNMFTYGFNYGKLTIERNGLNSNYIFENNAESIKLPSFERLCEILKTAGVSISSNEGISMFGMGIEVFGLESRVKKNSTVNCEITVIKDGLEYGGEMCFDGRNSQIRTSSFSPRKTNKKNGFIIKYINCANLDKKQVLDLKSSICDKLYFLDHPFTFIFKYYEKEETLLPVDFLYKTELENTDNYKKLSFEYEVENGVIEELDIEISNLHDLIKSGNCNFVDSQYGTKANPNLSGVALICGQYETVCRGNDSWRIIGCGPHSTQHHIRINVTTGQSLFEQYHSESQVKRRTLVSITDLIDKYGEELKFKEKNTGKVYTATELKKLIKQIIEYYKTDEVSSVEKNELQEAISSCGRDELEILENVLFKFKDSKLKLTTLCEIIEEEIKKPCLSLNVN